MAFFKQTVRDVPLHGKTVLVRADYNVPLDKDGNIADDYRIVSNLPTLEYLLDQGCKAVVMSHLGRPEGRDPKYSLEVVAERLKELLPVPVIFVDDCHGDKVKMAVKKAPAKSVILLENLRFYEQEEANDMAHAKAIAIDTGARYFVQDGFGVVHRAHASTSAITQCIPSVAGLLLEKEYEALTSAVENPKRPLVSILGGAKISDKIEVIEKLEPLSDTILIGGAMANTFLAEKGYSMGKSVMESGQEPVLHKIYDAAVEKVGAENVDSFIMTPSDVAVATSLEPTEKRKVVPVAEIAENELALDIGDETIERYAGVVADAGTVLWNGPLGYSELPEFAHGSARMALVLATHPNVVSIIGGGDTADFVLHWDARKGESFSHVSTGGGAGLELLAGKKLPGVESLLDARR